MLQLPIILTWGRLLSAPLLVAVFFLTPSPWRDFASAIVFLLAMMTDFWDGFLARRFKISTRFGAFLDPVADKILVVTALLLLLEQERAPFVAVLLIVWREFCVSALREWMASAGKRPVVTVSAVGKWKTGMQTAAIALLLHQADIFIVPTKAVGAACLWLATILALWSAILYFRAAWQVMSAE